MDEQTAQVVLCTIAAAATVAWVAGLRFLLRSAAVELASGQTTTHGFGDEMTSNHRIVDAAEVASSVGGLSSRAATVMVSDPARFGTVRISHCTDVSLRFRMGSRLGATSPAALCLRGGELRFVEFEPGRTRIEYTIEVSPGRGLLWGGGVFLILGAISIVVGYWAIQTWVIPNPQPGVRWQTLQMFQVAHCLWPPFLFGGILRMQRRAARDAFDVLVHNLPYYEEKTA